MEGLDVFNVGNKEGYYYLVGVISINEAISIFGCFNIYYNSIGKFRLFVIWSDI